MDEAGKKKVDAILLLARESFGGRRRRSLVTLLTIFVVLAGLGSLALIYFWPRGSLPKLVLAAFDQVALPEEEVTLAAQLEPIEELPSDGDLSACALFFQELSSGGLVGKVATSPEGRAALKARFPASTEIVVRFAGEGDRRRGVESNKARVFVWPAQSSLVVVDAVSALADIEATKFETTSNLDIPSRAGAAAVLRTLAAKRRIVYLAPETTRALSYNKLSAWLERAVVPHEKLPEGPLLVSADEEPAIFATAANLKTRFRGAVIGITGARDHARQFREAGLKTYFLGQSKELPDGVTAASSWKELTRQLDR